MTFSLRNVALTSFQLFQKDGEGGLEVCPGRKVVGDFGMGQNWLPVQARQDRIVCNIGDQLMRVSLLLFALAMSMAKADSAVVR